MQKKRHYFEDVPITDGVVPIIGIWVLGSNF